MHHRYCYFSLLLVFLSLSGCREDDEAISSGSNVTINGHVQKGPFINGTNLIITELDNQLGATGKTFTTQITDNRGSFFIKTSRLDYHNLQLIASGFYYDEVKGEKSAAQLTLFALASVSSDAVVNVNVLSHLEKDRILYLIEQGMDFSVAKQQAQREVLAMFGIERDSMTSSERLDISQNGEDNAILLAISAILQGDQTVAELSELLAEIITDLREDGTLDNETLKATLRQNAINLSLAKVRQNLVTRYQELELEATIPAFEPFVDSDGDGILNKDDDNLPEAFTLAAINEAMRSTVYRSEPVTVTGLPYPAIAKITQGKIIKNGQSIAGDTTYVTDGDVLAVELLASPDWNETLSATLQVGDYSTDFSVQVQAYPWASALTGVVQQGPFINGSSLSLTEVDSSLSKTTTSYDTKVSNSLGEYGIDGIEQHYPWTLLEAEGHYYNLVSGSTSDGELNLVGYTDLATATTTNVNVLTHLEHRRVKHLINSGLSFAKAKQQALREVLAIFEIEEEVSITAEQFDITRDTPEGAMLLAISVILQGYESTGTLQSLLTSISQDLEIDGTLNDKSLGSFLVNNANYLDLDEIREVISEGYSALSEAITAPILEEYLKHFKTNTDFEFTKPIVYPDTGLYGNNVLAGNENIYKAGINYSLAANLPIGAKLKIVVKCIKKAQGYGFGAYLNSEVNYNVFIDNSTDRKFTLEAIESGGKCDYHITLHNDDIPIYIEFYEYGSSIPTKIKQLTVN